jgi:hypothetical protein
MKPKEYEILRQVTNSSQFRISLLHRPREVWTLLDEDGFNQVGTVHWHTAFLEDRIHDWDWHEGEFRFYGHSGEPGDKHDLLLIYER